MSEFTVVIAIRMFHVYTRVRILYPYYAYSCKLRNIVGLCKQEASSFLNHRNYNVSSSFVSQYLEISFNSRTIELNTFYNKIGSMDSCLGHWWEARAERALLVSFQTLQIHTCGSCYVIHVPCIYRSSSRVDSFIITLG